MLQARKIVLTGADRNAHDQHAVALRELLTPRFLTNHTTFSSLEDMIARSPGGVATDEAFIALPTPVRDAFVARNSGFRTWDRLINFAIRDYSTSAMARSSAS